VCTIINHFVTRFAHCPYSPRNGKDISMFDFVHALIAGYHLSTFFAWFLTIGGFLLLQQFGRISLGDLARHNRIEHDASLAHKNTELEAEYAPCEVDDSLLESLCSDARPSAEGGARMNAEDIARARIRRENESPALDAVHAEIARGEMAIVLGVFGGKNGSNDGVPVEWLREWIKDERLPQGWKYTHTQGIFESIRASGDIRNAMKRLAEVEDPAEDVVGNALSDSSSSGEDSSFVSGSGEAHESTPPTSDSEDGISAENKPDDTEKY